MESGDSGDPHKQPPYFRYAFHNAYNYALLGGSLSAAVLTQNWWLGLAGLGAEVLWMLFAPDSKLLQRAWFDPAFVRQQADEAEREWLARLDALSEEHRERAAQLQGKRARIVALAQENQAFVGSAQRMLHTELAKLRQLLGSFVSLLFSTQRYQEHLGRVDYKELEQEIRRNEQLVREPNKAPLSDETRIMAQKNLAVLQKRREKLQEIRGFVERAGAQLDLIENTFDLLVDQIVTMRSPQDLHSQLDDLLEGVEAVRSTARETEFLLESS